MTLPACAHIILNARITLSFSLYLSFPPTVQMVSGLANMPPGGIERLTPSIKVRPSARCTAAGNVAMPTSHVCTFEFKLPRYTSREELARMLRIAIEFGHSGEFVFS